MGTRLTVLKDYKMDVHNGGAIDRTRRELIVMMLDG
jgi:hypothetical protein